MYRVRLSVAQKDIVDHRKYVIPPDRDEAFIEDESDWIDEADMENDSNIGQKYIPRVVTILSTRTSVSKAHATTSLTKTLYSQFSDQPAPGSSTLRLRPSRHHLKKANSFEHVRAKRSDQSQTPSRTT